MRKSRGGERLLAALERAGLWRRGEEDEERAEPGSPDCKRVHLRRRSMRREAI